MIYFTVEISHKILVLGKVMSIGSPLMITLFPAVSSPIKTLLFVRSKYEHTIAVLEKLPPFIRVNKVPLKLFF